MAARRRALQIAALALEKFLNADTSDYRGAEMECPKCGGRARYCGRQEKTFQTVLGSIRLSRAYYHCRECREGFYPRDIALGMERTAFSPGVTRMICHTASMVSFAESSELLAEIGGVEVNAKQVERIAEGVGEEMIRYEREVFQESEEPCKTMYLGVDGTGVPMRREEVVGRRGKDGEGMAKTREAKLCTIWTAERRDEEGKPLRDPGSVTYSGGIESAAQRDTEEAPSEFALRVLREVQRRGFLRAGRQVVIGDGAKWIWKLAEEHFPSAIQIVDRYHAKERLYGIGKDIFGATSDLWRPWAEQRCKELDRGEFGRLLRALAVHSRKSEEARKGVNYFSENQERMRYPYFESLGLCTSSGVLEAGCKTAIGARLKRGGMHWSLNGANAIIALRCCKLSGRFEDFWEHRASGQR